MNNTGSNGPKPPGQPADRPIFANEAHFCNVPGCLERRAKKGQDGARWLLAHQWTFWGLVISIICPNCGTRHQYELTHPGLAWFQGFTVTVSV